MLRNKLLSVILFFFLFPFIAQADEPQIQESEILPDVFAPPIQQAPVGTVSENFQEERSVTLDGLGMGGGKALAVINGRVYRGGQQKEGIQVTQIRKKEVDVLVNGLPRTLKRKYDEYTES